jgi:hypothetical protein
LAPDTLEDAFQALAERFNGDPRVTAGTGFGSSPGLRVDGKIFAMLTNGQLVVKLPKARVSQLVEAGTGAKFDPGHGRLMNEWLAVVTPDAAGWAGLVEEALDYVARLAARRAT